MYNDEKNQKQIEKCSDVFSIKPKNFATNRQTCKNCEKNMFEISGLFFWSSLFRTFFVNQILNKLF